MKCDLFLYMYWLTGCHTAGVQQEVLWYSQTITQCEDTAKYLITGSVKYKRICINRHIKYYVITEHIFICGVAMETHLEMEMLFLWCICLILWPPIVTAEAEVHGKGIVHISTQSIQKNPDSCFQGNGSQKYQVVVAEREREREEQPERNDWQRFLFTLQVFTPFVANV